MRLRREDWARRRMQPTDVPIVLRRVTPPQAGNMRLSTEVFFTAARKRDRQPAEFCPTLVNSTECELRAVDVTDATSEIPVLAAVLSNVGDRCGERGRLAWLPKAGMEVQKRSYSDAVVCLTVADRSDRQ